MTKHFGNVGARTCARSPECACGLRRARPRSICSIGPGAQQTYAFVGTLGPDRASPDFAALEVLAPILGASSGSRLAQNLRERHSYMYSGTPAAVTWRRGSTPSVIGGSAAVSTAKTDSALYRVARRASRCGPATSRPSRRWCWRVVLRCHWCADRRRWRRMIWWPIG